MWDKQLKETFARLTARVKDPIGSVIDIGASNGCWTQAIREFFPGAKFHLIEAFDVHEPRLKSYVSSVPNTTYVLAAAGPEVGKGHFWEAGDIWGGAVLDQAVSGKTREVAQTTIDHEIERLGLKPPYFIKLDTHGFEREILAGAERALKQARLVQLEMYNFEFRKGIGMHRTMGFMEELGFRCSDLFDPMWRDLDKAFWQIDMIFEPKNAPVFSSNAWA